MQGDDPAIRSFR